MKFPKSHAGLMTRRVCSSQKRLDRTCLTSMIVQAEMYLLCFRFRYQYAWMISGARTHLDAAKLKRRMVHLKRALTTAPAETNARGNFVRRSHRQTSRYEFDHALLKRGYRQYDTNSDAPYFGVWVDVENRVVFSYIEGDLIEVSCSNRQSFIAELQDMRRFYGSAPPWAVAITGDGMRSQYYDTRPGDELLGPVVECAA